ADEAGQDAEPRARADGFELEREAIGAYPRAALAEVSHQEGHRAEVLVRRVVRHPRARAPASLGPRGRLRRDQARGAVDRGLDRPQTDAKEVVARGQPVLDPEIGFTSIELGLAVRLHQLDRELGVPRAQATQARREKARHAELTVELVETHSEPDLDRR